MKHYFIPAALAAFLLLSAFEVPRVSVQTGMGDPLTFISAPDSTSRGISYTIVPRDPNAPYSVFVDKIRQDNKTIGSIHDGKKKDWGKNATVFEFALPNGTVIAEAAAIEKDSRECIIHTFRDNRKHTIPLYNGYKEMDMIGAKFLIEKGYL